MKTMKIIPPEGYEIDEEKSTFKEIVFKSIELTYGKICQELFNDNLYYSTSEGIIGRIVNTEGYRERPNNATSSRQVEKILALNKLYNVAVYYNRKHLSVANRYYTIIYSRSEDKYDTLYTNVNYVSRADVIFNRKEDAQAVIDNPNFRTILDTVYK